jgi:hypothetical protein
MLSTEKHPKTDLGESLTDHDQRQRGKQIIWLKKEIGDEKCHLIFFLNFHGLLRNMSAAACIYKICVYVSASLGGGGGWEAGVYIMENTPLPPPGRGKISAAVIWGKKYEKGKRKSGKMQKKKEERGKKMRKGEVKG